MKIVYLKREICWTIWFDISLIVFGFIIMDKLLECLDLIFKFELVYPNSESYWDEDCFRCS